MQTDEEVGKVAAAVPVIICILESRPVVCLFPLCGLTISPCLFLNLVTEDFFV